MLKDQPENQLKYMKILGVISAILFLPIIGVLVHAVNTPPAMNNPIVINYYSPAKDLEAIDVSLLESAKTSIDASEYALTDPVLAQELLKKANQGIHIRIYRDLRQYEDETSKPSNEMALFKGHANVQIKVKHSSVLAHLKAYVIDYNSPNALLREGSANWSESGEQKQDNSLIIIRELNCIKTFEDNFNVIWSRPDNKVIQ